MAELTVTRGLPIALAPTGSRVQAVQKFADPLLTWLYQISPSRPRMRAMARPRGNSTIRGGDVVRVAAKSPRARHCPPLWRNHTLLSVPRATSYVAPPIATE
ncbi:hypothetical protein SGLAM104S_00376 [Streptomyces glaucescens]